MFDTNLAVNTLRGNATKWSNTLKQFVGCQPTNCSSVFDYFVELVLKGLMKPTSDVMDLNVHSESLVLFPLKPVCPVCYLFAQRLTL